MTEELQIVHLDRYEDPDHVKTFEEHLATCPVCKAAPSQREACPVGVELHERMVLGAHEARKAAR